MQNVMVTLRELSADEAERRLAEQAEKDEMDRIAQIEFGRQEGYDAGMDEGIKIGEARGIEIGEARGETKKGLETARRMKEYGDPIDKIADITGLSLDEIAQL